MQRIQKQGADDIMQNVNTCHLAKVGQANQAGGRSFALGLLQERQCLCLDVSRILMPVSREQPETPVLELKLTGIFRNASLAQEQCLPPQGERLADDRPFL